jgi:hypothetical protein
MDRNLTVGGYEFGSLNWRREKECLLGGEKRKKSETANVGEKVDRLTSRNQMTGDTFVRVGITQKGTREVREGKKGRREKVGRDSETLRRGRRVGRQGTAV